MAEATFPWLDDTIMSINAFENNNNLVLNWTHQDCYNWASGQVKRLNLLPDRVNITNFLNFTGRSLQSLSAREFNENFSEDYGGILYEVFQDTVATQCFDTHAQDHTITTPGLIFPEFPDESYWDQLGTNTMYEFGASTNSQCGNSGSGSGGRDIRSSATPEYREEQTVTSTNLQNEDYVDLQPASTSYFDFDEDADINFNLSLLSPSLPPSPPSPSPSSSSPSSSSSSSLFLPPHHHYYQEDTASYSLNYVPQAETWTNQSQTCTPPYHAYPTPAPTQQRTRPRRQQRPAHTTPTTPTAHGTPNFDSFSDDPLRQIQTPSRKRSRGPKSWEFIMRLLVSSRYNPSLVSWVNESDGTFKLNKPAEIAKIWGQRSPTSRDSLSYDNFARGLRYHYGTGALEPVSERQLVYKCGDKAVEFLNKLRRHS